MHNPKIIIDFDSTFTRVEALDELVEISLENDPRRDENLAAIKDLTDRGMDGSLGFTESLEERIKLLHAERGDLEKLVKKLKKKVSKSFSRNRQFLTQNADNIYIVSGGFKEFIVPVVKPFGISEDHVFANDFVYDANGKIIGFNRENPLAQENGKVKLLKSLDLDGEIIVIGDGYTDYQLRASGLAHRFFAFTENIERALVSDKADHVTPSFDEFLYVNKLPRAISYPRNRINVVIIDNDDNDIIRPFANEGFNVQNIKRHEVSDYIRKAGVLLVPAGYMGEEVVLDDCQRLKAIGILGSVPENLDAVECMKRGIALFADKKNNPRNIQFIPKRLIDYINRGSTHLSSNFPNIYLQQQRNAHRLLHIHHNQPGVMARINNLLADHEINITGQYLKTNEHIGFVITDVNKKYDPQLIDELRKIKGTIGFRVLY